MTTADNTFDIIYAATSRTSHGPYGKGESGPCDNDCFKCRAERWLAQNSAGQVIQDAIPSATAAKMTLPDILRKAIASGSEGIVIMRAGSDYQVRLSGRDLGRSEMRYVDHDSGIIRPACSWFTFEGFSVESTLADDWEIVDEKVDRM